MTTLNPRDLVGAHIEHRLKKEIITYNFSKEAKIISTEVAECAALPNRLRIVLLAEMLNGYTLRKHYMMVRSAFVLGRDRPVVLEYLKTHDLSQRQENLLLLLSKHPTFRREIVRGIKYFVTAYPRRLPDFKSVLNREEYIYCA